MGERILHFAEVLTEVAEGEGVAGLEERGTPGLALDGWDVFVVGRQQVVGRGELKRSSALINANDLPRPTRISARLLAGGLVRSVVGPGRRVLMLPQGTQNQTRESILNRFKQQAKPATSFSSIQTRSEEEAALVARRSGGDPSNQHGASG